MSKQRWNIRMWRGPDEEEFLPWTPIILLEEPILFDDPEDDPRSIPVILSFNSVLDVDRYGEFGKWLNASFGEHKGKEKNQKRKYINQCMGVLNRGSEFRYLNYVYAEEYEVKDLSFIEPGLVEMHLTLAYKSMTPEPTRVIHHKEN